MAWTLTLPLNREIYSLEVIRRVAYTVAEQLCIEIQEAGAQWLLETTPTVLLGPNASRLTEAHARELIIRHLNDFALRDQIQAETQGIREVLAKAALRECGI